MLLFTFVSSPPSCVGALYRNHRATPCSRRSHIIRHLFTALTLSIRVDSVANAIAFGPRGLVPAAVSFGVCGHSRTNDCCDRFGGPDSVCARRSPCALGQRGDVAGGSPRRSCARPCHRQTLTDTDTTLQSARVGKIQPSPRDSGVEGNTQS